MDEPVISMGKIVRDDKGQPLMVKKYSDNLMTLLLKGHHPEKYRDRSSVEIGNKDGKPFQVEDARQRLIDKLDQIEARKEKKE